MWTGPEQCVMHGKFSENTAHTIVKIINTITGHSLWNSRAHHCPHRPWQQQGGAVPESEGEHIPDTCEQ